ncbi:hypothetical protein KC340_g16499 [Hortaea werneckii]|nr:hypothetical protein KC342_g15693 [Hortaea werneckii]KAI7062900.1 hypothetical protein KC339_g16444 [Hortaea werneckii]KAI7215409.1 hypothetical protein KC365_g13573 [Hortaea werneckii]KAI7293345.1 hypothetical protein KC340_g16499 [Hortaea werneckii]KAI7374769.1 hypothetical protein KC328_g15840 [Hortaea werneckii]
MAYTNDANKSSPGSFVTTEPLAPLLNGLKRAFDSSDHTDFTIICQGRQWKAHKVVLCAQSEWFKKSCAECWKEGQEGAITFPEDEPDVIEAMLHWFYEFDYGTSQDIKWPLALDVKVYAVAGKYLLPNLQRLAAAKFEQRAKKEWQSEDFAEAITEIYDGPLESIILRATVAQIVTEHRMELFHPGEGSKRFISMAGKIPKFGRDLLVMWCLFEHGDEWAKYNCPKCGACWAIEKKSRGTVLGCPKGCHSNRGSTWWDRFEQA